MSQSTSSMVRVRFAPSPTGFLHIGGARTALYNYLFARSQGGTFILRIEDTDLDRNSQESLWMLLEDLQWLGLNWDEGPDPNHLGQSRGPYGPYFQSQRLEIYRHWAQELLQRGLAYYCFLTDEEIEAQKKAKLAQGLPPHVESPYAHWSLEQALDYLAKGHSAAIRFRTPAQTRVYRLKDWIRGEVEFPSNMVGDFVIIRSDGVPVYNFCNVVDDHLMGVTHVLRAEEHLPNTLRQLMLYEAFGWTPPEFGHLSLILDENRKKLSKRRGATSCFEFRLEGYLPQALNNFVALLGWSHPEGREVLSAEELLRTFSLERVNPAAAQFDAQKLRWVNRQHLKAISFEEFKPLIQEYVRFLDRVFVTDSRLNQAIRGQFWETLKQAHGLSQSWTFDHWLSGLQELKAASEHPAWLQLAYHVKEMVETLWDVVVQTWFWCPSNWRLSSSDLTHVLTWPTTKPLWEKFQERLNQWQSGEFIGAAEFESWQQQWQHELGIKGAKLFMPIRLVLTGQAHGLETAKVASWLPVDRIRDRLAHVLSQVNGEGS